MNPTTARRNPAANQFLENPQPLPKLAEVIHCTRCGAKLRSTNINHAHIVTGPICTPCEQAIEEKKLERLWNQPMVDTAKYIPKKPKTVIKGQGQAAKERCHKADMDALAVAAATVNGINKKQLSAATGVCEGTCKIRLRRLFIKGWLLRPTGGRGWAASYSYTISDKGLDELNKEEVNG